MYLIYQPLHLWPGIPYIAPQVADTHEYGYRILLEEALRPRKVWIGDDQDTIGRIREVTLGGPHNMMLYRWARMWGKVPPAPTLSAYQGCEIFEYAS